MQQRPGFLSGTPAVEFEYGCARSALKGLVLWGVMNLSKGELKVGGAYIIERGRP